MTNPADIPLPDPWDQRAKSVEPMPGGYFGYLASLRELCWHAFEHNLSPQDMTKWIQDHFGTGPKQATKIESFLRRTGVLKLANEQLHLSERTITWIETEEDGLLIALLHSKIRFVGEMLAEIAEKPRSSDELRKAAKDYGLNWERQTQVDRRRGWIQSAGMITPMDNGSLAITGVGRELLSKLELYKPSADKAPPQSLSAPTPPETVPEVDDPESSLTVAPRCDVPSPTIDPSPAKALANEIGNASTDSRNPDRLEVAVRDAFRHLGFGAEKLGGPGKTDVLVTAPLGKNDSYSVTIDAKTVGSGSLGDGQVNWDALDEHRDNHEADYALLVAPNPSSKGRLMRSAHSHQVAVLSTEELAELCLLHAEMPLGLQEYRVLFETGGAVDTTPIKLAHQESARLRALAAELCEKLAKRTGTFGPLTAPQLMVMIDQPDKPSSEQEIQQTLDALASPLVGAVKGTASTGYVLATAPRVIQQRLQQLGDQISGLESS